MRKWLRARGKAGRHHIILDLSGIISYNIIDKLAVRRYRAAGFYFEQEAVMRNWTPEARKAQSESIRRWQPWKSSTGPKTQKGKDRCRLNAVKHGGYTVNMYELARLLRRQARLLADLRKAGYFRKSQKFVKQTIMNPSLALEGWVIIRELEICISRQNCGSRVPGDPIFSTDFPV